MSYVENNLLVKEEILYQAHLHWIIFLSTIIWFAASVILFSLPQHFDLLGYITLIIALFYTLIAFIRYKTSEYALTNKRVLVKIGFISRSSVETFLQKVEGIQVEQGIMGRIFNFGSIIICGTGGGKDRFAQIANPLEFRKQVQQQIEKVLSSNKQAE